MLAKLEDIKPNNLGLRKNALSLAPLMKSIQDFGFVQPIIVNQDSVIIDGNNRYEAAQKLGLSEIPVIVVNMSQEDMEKYAIIHSQVQQLTGWNFAAKKAITEKYNIDIGAYGMSDEMRHIDDIDGFFTEDDTISLF